MLESLEHETGYEEFSTVVELGRPFKPGKTSIQYLKWPKLPYLFPASFPGVKTSRDPALVDIDRAVLETRMRRYFNPGVPDASIAVETPALMVSSDGFDALKTRRHLLEGGFEFRQIVRYCYRPFDVRWLYWHWHPETKLLDRSRPEYFSQVFDRNFALVSQQKPRREWSTPQIIRSIGCLDLMDRGATCTPLKLRTLESERDNLSESASAYLNTIGSDAEALFFHALAVLHSSAYRNENSAALRQDWPRVPLPASREALVASAALGRRVAALLDTETAVPSVTTGRIRADLQDIAAITRAAGGALQPHEFALTAGWGYAGPGGVTCRWRQGCCCGDAKPGANRSKPTMSG